MGVENWRWMNEVFIHHHLLLLISSCFCSVHFLLESGIFTKERNLKGGQGNQNTERKILLSSVGFLSSLKCLKSNILLRLNLINS